MSRVAETKAAIPSLRFTERAEMANCLNQWPEDSWDKQMKRCLTAGRLAGLLSAVDTDMAQGKLHDLHEH